MAKSTEIIPEIRFKPVIKRYRELSDLLVQLPAEENIDSEWLAELQRELERSEQCCFEEEADKPLKALLRSFLGRKRTPQLMDDLAWRIAACFDVANAGRDTYSSFQKENAKLKSKDRWVALTILSSCVARLSRNMKPLIEARIRVLSGPFGGLVFKQLIPHYWFVNKLGKELGGGTRERRRPDHRMMGGFWLVGRLQLSDPEKPEVADFRAPPVVLDHNRELRRTRGQPCPVKFAHACHECWVGWMDPLPEKLGETKCAEFLRKDTKGDEKNMPFTLFDRATHPKHFVIRRCSYCKREASFDPTHGSRYCVSCQTRLVRTYGRS